MTSGVAKSINEGVVDGFRRGILTSASIVAMGAAFESAVALARQNPGLGVGIHLVLDEHDPALPASEIPSLVTSDGKFRSAAAAIREDGGESTDAG